MEKTPPAGPAQAVQDKQQQDAKALFERLQQIEVTDLTVHYTLEHSAVTLPAVLIRLLTLAVLFRWNSANKWHAVLRQKLLPEPWQTWLDIEDLAELAERATVDWMPAGVLLDTLAWQVARCLTQCALPQPIAVIRQTIRDLLLREALVSEGGLVLNRNFWRRVAKKGRRPLSAGLLAECRQRIQFVLGQVDLAQAIEGRWLEIPELESQQRAKLEAVQVAEPTERLQALQEAFSQGQFDFVAQLLACSYSRYGRRAHHPLLMIKGFATERLSAVMEYLVLWHQFLLLGELGIEIGSDFGTDSADMHAQARMKSDAAAKHLTPLLGWLIGECRSFCQATGRDGLSEADRALLLQAFESLDWKALGNFARNRQALLRVIDDTLKGGLVTPGPTPVNLDSSPRAGPIQTDLAEFAKALAAEFFERMKVFGEKFDSSVFYDPEGSAHTKRGKTVHGYGVQFLTDLRFGLVWRFAVFRAGDGFRPQIADWVLETKKIFGWGPMQLTSDREYTISKAIHQWHAGQVFHYGPRADIDRKDKGIFVEADFEIHKEYAICPNGAHLNRKPNVFVRGSSEQWRYQAKKYDCQGCLRRGQCTKGQNPRMLCINVYREDLAIHAARMQADPQRTRDLMGRHRAMSEGIVNNLMNHQGVRHACWKGLALARSQVGLAVLLLNTLKWYKIRHGQLRPMALRSAA